MLSTCLLAAVLVFQACLANPLDSYITDGTNAEPGEFPYQVSIRWGVPPLVPFRHSCGGSILNERFILTAGHCILPIGRLQVAAGKHKLMAHEATEQIIPVVQTIVHPGYPGGVAQHDIALLKLASPLVFNEVVSAIKLPGIDGIPAEPESEAVLSGWGSISKKLLPVLPPVLQKTNVPIIKNDVCYQQLTSKGNVGKKPELFDTQVCSGTPGGSACSGDSGGPLAYFSNGVPVQVGIVSWGMYPCGSGSPSVYTRVSSYVDWIQQNMA